MMELYRNGKLERDWSFERKSCFLHSLGLASRGREWFDSTGLLIHFSKKNSEWLDDVSQTRFELVGSVRKLYLLSHPPLYLALPDHWPSPWC